MYKFIDFIKNTSGATSAEYALVVSLVAMAIISAVLIVGENVCSIYSTISENLQVISDEEQGESGFSTGRGNGC
jgi:Flp pilus assembly pilin Flp